MVAATTPLIALGTISATLTAYRLARFLYVYLRPSSLPRYLHANKDGQSAWALVTGASNGIGLQLTTELARRGFNVVLHGRNASKLENVKTDLEAQFPQREFKLVILDACATGDVLHQGIERLTKEVSGLNLTVLINNAGGTPPSSTLYQVLERNSPAATDGWIDLNVRFMMHLTTALLPVLKRNEPALVMSIGSMAEEGSPYLSLYAGAKGFVTSWSKGLGREMRAEGRDVEVLGIRTGKVTGAGGFTVKPSLVSWFCCCHCRWYSLTGVLLVECAFGLKGWM